MEKLSLWYCDNVVNASWQFALLLVPLVGAFLYGREKHRLAWILIGSWVGFQILLTTLTNLVFGCSMGE